MKILNLLLGLILKISKPAASVVVTEAAAEIADKIKKDDPLVKEVVNIAVKEIL